MNRPADKDKCGACNHAFEDHYATFTGKKMGCTVFSDNQRDPWKCDCKGFAVIYTWQSNAWSSSHDIYQRGGPDDR